MAEMAPALVSGGVTYEIQRLIGSSFTISYKIEQISQAFGYNPRLPPNATKIVEAWPEEEQALKDIITGKTKMIRQTGEEFLKELKDILDE